VDVTYLAIPSRKATAGESGWVIVVGHDGVDRTGTLGSSVRRPVGRKAGAGKCDVSRAIAVSPVSDGVAGARGRVTRGELSR